MICSLSEIRSKEVINVNNGTKLGYVDDIEINTDDASVIALIVYGQSRFFGLFGHDDDIVIKCDQIQLIGRDAILVVTDDSKKATKSRQFSVENLLK